VADRHSINPDYLPVDEKKVTLIKGDLLDKKMLSRCLEGRFDAIVHCAAIAAVDRSIKEPSLTLDTNSTGTLNLFESAREFGVNRIHYVSTDEVFGEISNGSFNELSASNPRNPYAAGKLSGEAIASGWAATYNMHITITNGCNNFGEYQSPDKLIPRLTIKAIKKQKLPVYGDGQQEREWMHVSDHVEAILMVLDKGAAGERYCVGSGILRKNLDIVNIICDEVGINPADSIEFVKDRPGHDRRYALDCAKIKALGWQPLHSSEDAIRRTIQWYVKTPEWWSGFNLF